MSEKDFRRERLNREGFSSERITEEDALSETSREAVDWMKKHRRSLYAQGGNFYAYIGTEEEE